MSGTPDLHPLTPLSALERDGIEAVIDRALRAMKTRARRDLLRFLLDFPGSTIADLTRGLQAKDAEKDFNILRRAGMIAPVQVPKKKGHPHSKRYTRWRVSPYGVRWLRTLYGNPDLDSDAMPRAKSM